MISNYFPDILLINYYILKRYLPRHRLEYHYTVHQRYQVFSNQSGYLNLGCKSEQATERFTFQLLKLVEMAEGLTLSI